MSRRVADWRRARSSTRDRSRAAARREGRQLRDSIYSCVLQCLAITRPPMTRQPGPSKGRGGAITGRLTGAPPHRRLGMSRRGADWRRARSSTRDPSRATACREGRQLRDSICSRVLPVPRHHTATDDTPTGPSKGRGGADNTAASPAPPRRRVGMSRRGADCEEALGSTGDRSQRKGAPERAAASRQHLLTRPASASPSHDHRWHANQVPPRGAGER